MKKLITLYRILRFHFTTIYYWLWTGDKEALAMLKSIERCAADNPENFIWS